MPRKVTLYSSPWWDANALWRSLLLARRGGFMLWLRSLRSLSGCVLISGQAKKNQSEARREPAEGMCISAVSQQVFRGYVLILPLDGEWSPRHALARLGDEQGQRMYPLSSILAVIESLLIVRQQKQRRLEVSWTPHYLLILTSIRLGSNHKHISIPYLSSCHQP